MFRDAHKALNEIALWASVWQQYCPYPCRCVRGNYIFQSPILSRCFHFLLRAAPLPLLLSQPLASTTQLRPLILHQQGFPQEIPDSCSQRYWTACHIPHTATTRACIVGSSVRSACPSLEYAWQLDGCFMPQALQPPLDYTIAASFSARRNTVAWKAVPLATTHVYLLTLFSFRSYFATLLSSYLVRYHLFQTSQFCLTDSGNKP